jgi:hypothetical protein
MGGRGVHGLVGVWVWSMGGRGVHGLVGVWVWSMGRAGPNIFLLQNVLIEALLVTLSKFKCVHLTEQRVVVENKYE